MGYYSFLLPISPNARSSRSSHIERSQYGVKRLGKTKMVLQGWSKRQITKFHTLSGSSSVEWVQGSLVAHKQPLTWYKVIFNSPGGFNEKKCQTNCGQPSQIWYAIVRDMTAAGLCLNKFCYAALIAAQKNKEPFRDDIASKMERTRTRDVEDAETTLAIGALVRRWGVGHG
ncbi:hypothetical protein FXO38_30835 [Capsicum annuum]|nr:hypothetical protein FXO37_35933 [Capsicum annuum]KAF3623279.1 hypothetical protein FXO38_30835 [Capsicum annuum]